MTGSRQQKHIAVFPVGSPISKVWYNLVSRRNQALRSVQIPEEHRRELEGMMTGSRQQQHIAVLPVGSPISKVWYHLLSRRNQALRSGQIPKEH